MRRDAAAAFIPPPPRGGAGGGRLCLVRGCGDIGSAVAHALFRAGHPVVIHDVAQPAFARRGMAYTDAMFDGVAVLDGVVGRRVADAACVGPVIARAREIPLLAGQFGRAVARLRPHVLIDARMNKRALPDRQKGLAPLTIGLGPNFVAGATTDVVIETAWEALGAIITSGPSLPLHGEPRLIAGYGRERYVYAPAHGIFTTARDIGDTVLCGEPVAFLGGTKIAAPLDGTLRGITRCGVAVDAGMKVVEIDPRGDPARARGIAERPGRIAAAVLAAVSRVAPMRVSA